MDDDLQQQARALGDPTRYAIFRTLADAGVPVGIGELTEHFEFNHNAIRQHLARLVDAGLVVETTAPPSGPGRPRLVYEIAPAVHERWGAIGSYERLSGLLAEAVATGRSPRDVGRATAARAGVRTGDALADVAAEMTRQGFAPEVRNRRSGADIVLHHCPFAGTALRQRSTVCALHLGIAEGLCEGTGVRVRELVAHDPRRAGCRIVLDEASADREDAAVVLRPARLR
ncbi:MAG: helix-turn-helix transcriptional regulator [Acidimicrobiia bacterium]